MRNTEHIVTYSWRLSSCRMWWWVVRWIGTNILCYPFPPKCSH